MSARPGSSPLPLSSPGRIACSASSEGGGSVPTTSGSSEPPVIGLFSGLASCGRFCSICSGVGSGGTRGDVRLSPAIAPAGTQAKPAAMVAAASNPWNLELDMGNDLDLVVQRIDLNGRAGSGLSTQSLKDLIGRRRRQSDRDLERLRVRRRRRVERVADAGRELGHPLVQRPAPLERYDALQIRGHNRLHLPCNRWRQPAELGHLDVDMLHALPQCLFRVRHAWDSHGCRNRTDAYTSGRKRCGNQDRSDGEAYGGHSSALSAGAQRGAEMEVDTALRRHLREDRALPSRAAAAVASCSREAASSGHRATVGAAPNGNLIYAITASLHYRGKVIGMLCERREGPPHQGRGGTSIDRVGREIPVSARPLAGTSCSAAVARSLRAVLSWGRSTNPRPCPSISSRASSSTTPASTRSSASPVLSRAVVRRSISSIAEPFGNTLDSRRRPSLKPTFS